MKPSMMSRALAWHPAGMLSSGFQIRVQRVSIARSCQGSRARVVSSKENTLAAWFLSRVCHLVSMLFRNSHLSAGVNWLMFTSLRYRTFRAPGVFRDPTLRLIIAHSFCLFRQRHICNDLIFFHIGDTRFNSGASSSATVVMVSCCLLSCSVYGSIGRRCDWLISTDSPCVFLAFVSVPLVPLSLVLLRFVLVVCSLCPSPGAGGLSTRKFVLSGDVFVREAARHVVVVPSFLMCSVTFSCAASSSS